MNILEMKNAVQAIKKNYRERIHQLRIDEKNKIATEINESFDQIFINDSLCKDISMWYANQYKILNKDNYYIYIQNLITNDLIKMRKDEAIFKLVPKEG